MSVVAAWVYRDGRRNRPVEVGRERLDLAQGEFVWIGLNEPDEAELRSLQDCFGLHPLAVEDALTAHQLPKLDVYGECLFVVARTAWLADDDQVEFGETDIFVGHDYIITVRHGSRRGHKYLRERLEAAPSLLKHGVDYVLHAVLDFVVAGYLPVVDSIEEEVLEMEQQALDGFLTRAEVSRIFLLRRELLRKRRILGPLLEVIGRLEHLDTPFIDPEARPYFGDVADHVKQVTSRVDALREVLSWVFEAGALLEQQRQGDITRKLAAWAAILAVPTALAGVYGMNFEFMPELHWKYGYAVAVALMAAVCGWLYYRFKRTGWL